MEKKIFSTAAIFGVTAIILGAFGAHLLKKYLSADQLGSFETGVKYQMYHALFLLFLGTTAFISEKAKKSIYWLTLFGVVFFSGSIYLLATMSISHVNFKVIGMATPIGGALLIGAWSILLIHLLKKKS